MAGSTSRRAVAALVTWALEGAPALRLAIVTFPVVRLALAAALGDDVATAWHAAGQARATFDEARAVLGPILARLLERPDLGHYGAIRGLDHWRDHDAIVTLGDHGRTWATSGTPRTSWGSRTLTS